MKKRIYALLSVTTTLLLLGSTACAGATEFPLQSASEGDGSTMPEISEEISSIPGVNEENSSENTESEETSPVPEPEPIVNTASYIKILTNALNIRKGATTSSASLGQAEKGTSMAYLGKEGSFYMTYYKNSVAYVSANGNYTGLYESIAASEEIEKVIEEGCKLIGTPYVYGATRYHDGNGNLYKSFTVTKFDCSSLTQYTFYKGAGVLLQVNTRTQIYQGKHVDKSGIQRGDLLFFTNSSRYNNTGIERVGHVALYLGNNLILHTASDFCKIEEISVQRWSYYLEARRIL